MEVRTNKIEDVRNHYRKKLTGLYAGHESDILIYQLLTEFTGFSKAELLARQDERITESELLKIHFGVKELLKNKPIQYVLGKAEFYDLTFKVNSKVLIPRPETEELVHLVIKNFSTKQPLKIIDIGTGSGCIAITLKKYFPECEVTAIDVSEFALDVAQQNALLNKTEISFKKLDFLQRQEREMLGNFDLVVSNPPYVRPSEKTAMNKNVLDYEPVQALFVPENDPLIFYRAIAAFCHKHLLKGGQLFCETNQYLQDEILNILKEGKFEKLRAEFDMNRNFRFVIGTK